MSIFDGRKSYGSWAVKDSKPLSKGDLEATKTVVVRDGEFGLSACFSTTGGVYYIPLSNNAAEKCTDGEVLDKNEIIVLTLMKEGNADITRIDI